MGNANNSKDPEDPKLSIGSSVDPLPLQKGASAERKRLEIHEEEGKRLQETQNENRLLAPNQNGEDSIEFECIEEIQAVHVGVKLQSPEHRESAGFAFGPVIEKCNDLPGNMQSTLLFPKESCELKDESIFDDMRSPDRRNMNESFGVHDNWKEVSECEEKTEMLTEHMNNKTILSASCRHSDCEKDKCKTKGVEGSPRVDEKKESCKDLETPEDVYGPIIEPCDDFPDGIQNTTLDTMESSKSKTKNILDKCLSPETLEVDESSSVQNERKETNKPEEKGELLLNPRNNDLDLLTFHQSSDRCSQMDKDNIKAKEYEETQSTDENEELFKDQKSVTNASGPVIEPCDHFVDCIQNTSVYKKETCKSKGENSLEDLSPKRYDVDEKGSVVEGVNLAANVKGDDTTSYDKERQDISSETSAILQRLVHSCSESVDNLQQDHQYIMELVNKSCSSQSSLNETEGMRIITELETIVEKFTERRKEKENDIGELKSILSKLTDTVNVLEQEIQILQSKNEQNPSNKQIQREILPDDFWQRKASELSERLVREGLPDNECGWNTVLCLDVSDSMWGEAIRTMIRLALRFISGVEEASLTEKVGVICFGEDTRIISRCCLNFYGLRQEISKLKPGGPSPLTAGLLLSRVLVGSGVTIPHSNGVGFHPRIIILSDGLATPELVAGSEDFTPDSSELSVINTDMTRLAQHFRNNCNRVYYVPLGQANEGLIGPMVSMTQGKVVRPSDFDTLIHQFRDELLAVQIRPYLRDYRHAETSTVRIVAEASNASLRGINMDELAEYVRNPPPQRPGHRYKDDDDDDDNNDHGECSTDMPPIGTRVRRGPDWESRYGSQDSNGPGTVVSQDGDGFLLVMWDNGHRNKYPYGYMGRYAVMVVDEPRVLQHDQFIEVGCLVKRGNDWRDNNNDGGPESIGVVFRVYSDATVGVRWPTGLGRRYKYGKQGYFEVQLCDPFDEDVRLRMLSMNVHTSSDFGPTKPSDKERIRIEDLVNSDDRNNGILDEMNRKNASRSNQTRKHVTVDSGHPLPDNRAGQKETTKNMERTNVDFDDPKLIRPAHNSVDSTRHVDSNKYVEAMPTASNHVDNTGYTPKNYTDVKTRESSNQVPDSMERSEPSVENANGRVGAGDVIQKVVDEGGLEKLTQSKSSSLDVSINSDMSCDSEVGSIDRTPRQASYSSNHVQGNGARKSPTGHSTAHKDHDTAVQSVVWQVQDRYEGWKDFPNDISERLEKVFLKNPQGMTSYIKDEKRFQVQLSTMIQVHPKTKEMSPIRRKITLES